MNIPFNHHFPMVFLWFSYGFPMVLPGRVSLVVSLFVSDPPWHHRGAAVDGQPHRRHAGGHQQVTPGGEAPNGLATDHLPWPWRFDG